MGSGGGGGGEPSPPSRPLDSEGAEDQDLQQQPEKRGPKPGDDKQGRDEPKDGGPDRTEPERNDGTRKPDGETGVFERKDTSGRWGELAPKVQEMLRQYGDDQLPPRYRRLIERYYKLEAKRAKDEARRKGG